MHEFEITLHTNNHGYPYRATCECGWQSQGYVAWHAANSMGEWHVREELSYRSLNGLIVHAYSAE